MRLINRSLLLLLFVFHITIDNTVCSQPVSMSVPAQREIDTGNGKMQDTISSDDKLLDTLSDSLSVSNEVIGDDTSELDYPIDWGKRSFWATFADVIATILGIVAAIVTLVWMHKNSKKEAAKVQQQITLLEERNNHAKQQIQNQEKAIRESNEQSMRLNASIKRNVEDIKKYLTESELKIKLIEKKDTVHKTFVYLWNSSFRHEASKIKDGSIINNQAVLSGVIDIVTAIATFNDLHPSVSEKCVEKGKRCMGDMEYLSKKKKKGEDIAAWLEEIKQHFDELSDEMNNCINGLK